MRPAADPGVLTRRTLEPGPDLWERLDPIWSSLLERSGSQSAFLSREWMRTALTTFGPEVEAYALTWHDDVGRAVGCVVLSTHRDRIGPFDVRRTLLNCPFPWGLGAEHNDVLVDEAFRRPVLADLVDVLRGAESDEISLVGFRSETAEALRSLWNRDNWAGHRSESPYVDFTKIRGHPGEYLEQLSSNTRAQVRRSTRLYREIHGAPLVRVASDPGQAVSWFDECMSLHDARWASLGEASEFTEEDRAFHRRLISECHGSSGVHALDADIVRIEFGGRTLGLVYNLIYQGNVSYFQSGLAYDGDNRLKPGLVSHAMCVEHYIERGCLAYDFLGGEPDPVRYKRSLATDSRILYWAQLPTPSLRMDVIASVRAVRNLLRR